MTDRELLELAAKAAGEYYGEWSDRSNSFRIRYAGYWKEWNPLADDGDAMRLAVKLRMRIEHYSVTSDGCDRVGANNAPTVLYEGDSYAATRRAIVRAAAEIGKQVA